MSILRRLFDHSWKRYLAAFAVGTTVALLALAQRGFTLRICYMDALTMAGLVLILFGLLLMTGSLGAFDIVGYVFSYSHLDSAHRTLYDYREARALKRRGHEWDFMPYVTVGLLFLVVGLLLGIGL